MRHLSLILALAFLGGLLISSQALVAGQYKHRGTSEVGTMTGEQLQQWDQAQYQLQTRDEMQTQEQLATRQLTREQTVVMQRQLDKQGYRIGNIDGIIDNETMAAIQSFQADEGLTVTGMPNQETLGALVLSTPQQEFFGLSPEFGGDEE